ncbi:MAG: hypothetical protein KAI59_05340, partial [Planctomycetes bacterium]|nr:hypothetical protein [Planctomycetota bacterium]
MAANLIQNGNFTNSLYPWTAETGWTWSQNGGGSAQQYKYQNTKLYQNFNTETGASYKVTFNVLYMPVSTVNVGFKNANGDMVGVASFQGSGWKTFDFEAEIVANQIAF